MVVLEQNDVAPAPEVAAPVDDPQAAQQQQDQTPSSVKALAVTFGGYVLALLNMAYGLSKGAGN